MELDDINSTLEEQTNLQKELWSITQTPWESGVLPSADHLARARASLPVKLANDGLGFESVRQHILDDIVPALNGSSISSNYYGFVTGGVTPAALFADNIVSAYDQNVQVHLPDHSVATDVEYNALGLLVDLLQLDRSTWYNGTFTTGATASNILGLACGREFILRHAAKKRGVTLQSVGEHGLFEVMQASGISGLQVLSTLPHSSLIKAAGILGIGRANVKNVCRGDNSLMFDLQKLEAELANPDKATIVAVSCGEINTGQFATAGLEEMREIRRLCDKYGAWVHADGAFGIFGRILDDSTEFASIKKGCDGIELADSITGDGHKLLNVPYDCGFFLCRHSDEAQNVFQNANAAYLTSSLAGGPSIPSPLNIGIENSRRFRALPVYASLVAYGRAGYQTVLQRQIRLARKVAAWVSDHPAYEALPEMGSTEELLDKTYMSVLFSAKKDSLNQRLASTINATSKIFVSGTAWQGRSACRIAVSNWRVDVERDFAIVAAVLDGVAGE
ncbi:pyridoxal phosphate-dependent decarboxylase family protein [Aspergillus clavatus NRRL 1]|uniref:Tyrosine decarboxylase, putative n=1 Tax=Aspergillus clavatus (strain ATCC 1007 / CBS 513.65 / DSM 816 / NCTC 3887 / NRRL 1 / QM 1276 / 107) TaxID=344612 RepID=A1CEH6_ASPCL|nr:tyrosine decarboxylase, putative [Aspergillus clavatus NRRL 1]EAW11275.1 tyrosine decarboxylase, putative [Aspergillus clavatus NRRL 1]